VKYKALISRYLTMADENIQIVINDTEDFTSFRDRVHNALRLCDKRANTQMYRLFEDTDLTDSLSPEEFIKAEYAATLMYPQTHTEPIRLGENTAIEFSKNMASGEVIKLFLHEVEGYEEIEEAIENIYKLIDYRLVQTNSRELECIEYFKTLPMDLKVKVSMILDILYGRNTVENVVSRLTEENSNELPNGVYIKRNEE